MPELSLQKDLEDLRAIKASQLGVITELLNKKRPRIADIRRQVPDGFLRLLLVYSKLREETDLSEDAAKAVAPVKNWFEEKISEIESFPGLSTFLRQSEVVMDGATITIPKKGSDSRKNISKSMAVVNGFDSIPFLGGGELVPSLRVFLRCRDQILLDSSGDWDDWLYVTKCLLVSLDDQAESLTKAPGAWKSVPWESVNKHMAELKVALRSLEKHIKDNAPLDVKIPGRRNKK